MRVATIACIVVGFPLGAAARYNDADTYSSGGGAYELLILLVPGVIFGGYILGAETKTLKEARTGIIAMTVMMGIIALFLPRNFLLWIGGAIVVAGIFGFVRRKSS